MTNAAIYLRVSLDHTGEELAVKRQREDALKIIESRGWTLAGEYVDNSISASDSRKQRPGYDALCRDYEAGRFGALIAWDLDRLTRQPRQLEDWIDRAEERGLQLVTANGEADLSTDGGRMYARIKLAVAKGEVERKSARQRRAQQQRAEMGRPAKGVRLTGYTLDGHVVPAEAKIVRRIFDRFAAGDTLKGIAADLERDGIETRRGGRWTSSSVSSILRNARYAGRSVYKGEDVGAATWDAIVPESQFAAVHSRLDDPRRKTRGESTARKHLGSGLYFCTCGLRVHSSSGLGSGMHRYTCRNTCHYRSGKPVDDFVLAVIRGRLAQPDLRELLVRPADESELASLSAEREDIRHRMASFEADYDAGLIDGRRLKAATDKASARLEEVRRAEAKLLAQFGPDSILAAENPVEAFDAAPLAIRQQVIDSLAHITLKKGKHGSRTFDPNTVEIVWR
jgi:DNA invertase Pin-like site-specific DNA recombinase